MPAADPALPVGQGFSVFATTRWTVVLQAGGPTSDGSTAALEQLCKTYWYPLYSYARRSGMQAHDAEDITQGFFAFLLEKDAIARADRERGRFRSFLLSSFKNFQMNERARKSAEKRGGGRCIVSLDEMDAENRYLHEPAILLTPEKLYDQKWAASLLDQVMASLRAEYSALSKGPLFDVMRGIVMGGRSEAGYGSLAESVGMTEGAFKVAVHRMRGRLKECLRHEVSQTVAKAADVDDELRHLLSALTA